MPDLPIQTLESQDVFANPPWFAIRRDRIALPDGSEAIYNVITRPGGVWIVPVLPDGRMVLIRNYRHTIGGWLWEVPAGGLKDNIAPDEMARTELAEEIGGTAQSLERVSQFYTMPGASDEIAHIYLARGVTLGEPKHEPTEIMETHVFPVEDVVAMIHSGEIGDGPSALAVLLCLPRLNRQ